MDKVLDINALIGISKTMRNDILTSVYNAGSGHIGGSFSATELMTALFFNIMNHDPKNPDWKERDRFVLSKGHCTPAYYSVLARCGYFPVEDLLTERKFGSKLQGHPDKGFLNFVETSSGSLGQGLSIASGIAFALRLDNINSKVYCMIGDGELDEGQIWESLATIKKYNLNNLIIILDHNKVQLDGTNSEIKNLESIKDKFLAFGYNVEQINGHDINIIIDTFNNLDYNKNNILIAETIKGKGVSFMEGKAEWHGKAPNKEQYDQAMKELG